jgi:hypothetical protein
MTLTMRDVFADVRPFVSQHGMDLFHRAIRLGNEARQFTFDPAYVLMAVLEHPGNYPGLAPILESAHLSMRSLSGSLLSGSGTFRDRPRVQQITSEGEAYLVSVENFVLSARRFMKDDRVVATCKQLVALAVWPRSRPLTRLIDGPTSDRLQMELFCA